MSVIDTTTQVGKWEKGVFVLLDIFFFDDYIFTVWGSETEQKLKQGQSLGMVWYRVCKWKEIKEFRDGQNMGQAATDSPLATQPSPAFQSGLT